MNIQLTEAKCEACEGGTMPLKKDEAEVLLEKIPGWSISSDETSISRTYVFKNFYEALSFVNTVGELAESEGHHPDIHLTNYKKVTIELTTHAIGGLSKNDFILAAKIDA